MQAARHWHIEPDQSGIAVDCLAAATSLSKSKIKRAMACGAVWLVRQRRPAKRLRRATASVGPGDVLDCYYDPDILNREPPPAICVADETRYSVWFKPAGLLTQGSRYGDHCSLARQVEQHWDPPRAVFVVHRLDREASGLVLVAHDRDAAARLSALFATQAITKTYRVRVAGETPLHGEINEALDGKPAITRYRRLAFDEGVSVLDVQILTGRKHQIRRHLAGMGHAVLGDPRYGGRPEPAGLQLQAVALAFEDPWGNGKRDYRT